MKYLYRKIIRKIKASLIDDLEMTVRGMHDLQLSFYRAQLKKEAKNPINKLGAKYFSQSDEDGITLEILRRIGLNKGVFAEFGVGNGAENNTLILLANGWSGFWVGGQDLCFKHDVAPWQFYFNKQWVTKGNVVGSINAGIERLKATTVDVLSLDLDGNDIYLVDEILKSNVHPKLFIVEYNAKFPPPIQWQIDYCDQHIWCHDDYFGASLASFNSLFNKYGYTLVCCNFSGANAFFVSNELMEHFTDVPQDIGDLFYPPSYHLYKSFGHKSSPKTIEQLLISMSSGKRQCI